MLIDTFFVHLLISAGFVCVLFPLGRIKHGNRNRIRVKCGFYLANFPRNEREIFPFAKKDYASVSRHIRKWFSPYGDFTFFSYNYLLVHNQLFLRRWYITKTIHLKSLYFLIWPFTTSCFFIFFYFNDINLIWWYETRIFFQSYSFTKQKMVPGKRH